MFIRNQSSLSWDNAGLVTSRLATAPAVSVEVEGLPQDEPALKLASLLGWSASASSGSAANESLVNLLAIDRSAILKFRKHMNVVPAIKLLKAVTLDGERLHPEKFRTTKHASSDRARDPRLAEYNEESEADIFDREVFRNSMKDYLYADPATRYEIAKNAFEVELGKTAVRYLFCLFIIYLIMSNLL